MNSPLVLICFGIAIGVFSGIMGLGGGSVMIPLMVLALGLTQPEAHGTSLAVMIPPVTLPAVIEYYRNGNVKLGVALWMSAGVLLGTFFGAYLANHMPKDLLKFVFGLVLIYVAAYTVFGKDHLQRTTLLAAIVVIFTLLVVAATYWYDQRAVAG